MTTPRTIEDDALVPLFGTWGRAYAGVIAALVVNVALLYALTRWVS